VRSFDFGRELLKIVAVITMTVDHIGAILYPDLFLLRAVGRIAFPLFAYLITLGIENTKNPRKYLLTLFSFALVSQIPYSVAFEIKPFEQLNILFPLFLGAVSLYSFNRRQIQAFIPALFLAILFSILFNMEGTFYTILTVCCMKLLRHKPELGILALIGLNLSVMPTTQILSLLALPLVLLHTQNWLKKEVCIPENSYYYLLRKYAFYIYYPLHLTLIYLMSLYFF
jgi:TraX protein